MPMRCNNCNGTYQPNGTDGARYFHACPPTPNPLYQPDPTKPLFNLTQYIERVNKRDENVTLDSTGKAIGTVSAGTGVTAF